METLHTLNIIGHVAFGALALLLGLVPMMRPNGGAVHVRFGRWFLAATAAVLLTAVLGLVVFNFRAFLVIVVMISLYQVWSGYRAVKMRATGPTRLDALWAGAFLVGSGVFLSYLHVIDLVWSRPVIYSLLGGLVFFTLFDLARFAFVPLWRRVLWRYDHLWKMISAYFALAAAFSGTVLPQFKPYSQFLPSVLGMGLSVGFILYYARRRRKQAAQPQAA